METLSNFPSGVVLQTVRIEGAMLTEDVPCSTSADLDDARERRPAHGGTQPHQKGRSGITDKTCLFAVCTDCYNVIFHAASHPLSAVHRQAASVVLVVLRHSSNKARERFLGAASDACSRVKEDKQGRVISSLCAHLLLDTLLSPDDMQMLGAANPEM